jgi:alcohol dehydrogenase YqhD (iron-dependent ADH family)
MEYFKFFNPTKIVFGKNTINQIGEYVAEHKFKKVIILYGGGSIKSNGVYDSVVNSFKLNNIEWIEFAGVQPNPVVNHAREAIKMIKEYGAEAIIAVGGGSVIDEAKAIAAGIYVEDVWNILERKETITKALPLFTVLTLSATGTEMNSFAVLSNPEEKKKWSFGSPYSFPLVSIIDPTVQTSLPWRQTINGGVDSISHILELYFAGDETAEPTLAVNEALIRTIISSVDKLQLDESDYDSRANLAWCASLALSGFSSVAMNGGEWTVHRIEHAISVLFPKVAHAEGLAVVFPAWIKYVNKENPERFRRWAKNIFNDDNIEDGIESLIKIFKKWKAPVTLSELGINPDFIPALAENAMQQGTLGNFRKIEYDDVVNILNLTL